MLIMKPTSKRTSKASLAFLTRLEQYLKQDATVPPERRAEIDQILREMRAILAPIALAVVPDGATVQVDGRTVGRAPIGTIVVDDGGDLVVR